jgi:hypothetical protein
MVDSNSQFSYLWSAVIVGMHNRTQWYLIFNIYLYLISDVYTLYHYLQEIKITMSHLNFWFSYLNYPCSRIFCHNKYCFTTISISCNILSKTVEAILNPYNVSLPYFKGFEVLESLNTCLPHIYCQYSKLR